MNDDANPESLASSRSKRTSRLTAVRRSAWARAWAALTSGAEGDEDTGSAKAGWFFTELRRFKAREEFHWSDEQPELLRIAWLLRTKHEESRIAAMLERLLGALLTLVATAAAAIGAYIAYEGWRGIFGAINTASGLVVPSNLWEVVVATSGAVLLTGGLATLLFRVARTNFDRAMEHSKEMAATRRVETAVRLALATRLRMAPTAQRALRDLGLRLIAGEAVERPTSGAESDLTAVPDLIEKLLDRVEKLKSRE